jgi:heme-degrading monooxygenase HmoA
MNKKDLTDCYAVIFYNKLVDLTEEYENVSQKMFELAQKQSGFIGTESVRDQEHIGVTISYWESLEAIKFWRNDLDHLMAQQYGREKGYEWYHLCVSKVVYNKRFEKTPNG